MGTSAAVGAATLDARPAARNPWLLFWVLAAASMIVWQLVAADLTFFSDDWKVLAERSLTLDSLLVPYNEHLSAIPVAIMVLLRDSIGLGWHAVFLLPVHTGHVAACAGVFSIALRRAGRRTAILLAGLALFMGTGWADLLWAWQVGAVISTAAGVWAVACLDLPRPRPVLAALLLVVALASSSFAIPFVVAAGGLAGLRRNWSGVAGVAAATACYGLWYAGFHFTGQPLCGPMSAGQLATLSGPFMLSTLAYAVGAPLGIGQGVSIFMPVAAVAAAVWLVAVYSAWRRGHEVALAVASIAGIAALGILLADGRSCLTIQAPGASRYVYPTAMLVLVGVAGTRPAGVARQAADRIPGFAVPVLIALVLALQASAAIAGHQSARDSADIVRSAVALAFDDAAGRCHAPSAVVDEVTAQLSILPTPARIRQLVTSPAEIAAPAWVADGSPSPVLAEEVRQAMCDQPQAGGG